MKSPRKNLPTTAPDRRSMLRICFRGPRKNSSQGESEADGRSPRLRRRWRFPTPAGGEFDGLVVFLRPPAENSTASSFSYTRRRRIRRPRRFPTPFDGEFDGLVVFLRPPTEIRPASSFSYAVRRRFGRPYRFPTPSDREFDGLVLGLLRGQPPDLAGAVTAQERRQGVVVLAHRHLERRRS